MKISRSILEICFSVYIWILLIIDPYQPYLVFDASGFTLTFFSIFCVVYRKKIGGFSQLTFLIACLSMMLYANAYGMIHLPESGVPNQKAYLKLAYLFFFSYFLWEARKGRSRTYLAAIAILSSLHLLISWLYIVDTLRSLPLFLFLLLVLSEELDWVREFFSSWVFLPAISLVLSFCFSFQTDKSATTSLYFATGILAYLFGDRLRRKQEQFTSILLVFYTFFLSSVLALAFSQMRFQEDKFAFPTSIGSFQVNTIALISAMHFPFLVLLFLDSRKINRKLFYFILGISSLFVLYITHSRASLLSIFIAGAIFVTPWKNNPVLLLLLGKNAEKRILLWAPFALYIGLTILGVVFLLLIVGGEQFTSTQTLIARFHIWKFLVERVFSFSFWTGFGPGNDFASVTLPLENLSKETIQQIAGYMSYAKSPPNAHSTPIQVFYNFGMLGLVSLSLFWARSFYRFIKYPSNARTLVGSLGIITSLVIFLIKDTIDYTIDYACIFYTALLFLGLLEKSDVPLSEDQKLEIAPKNRGKQVTAMLLFSASLVFSLIFSLNGRSNDKAEQIYKIDIQSDNYGNLIFKNAGYLDDRKFLDFQNQSSKFRFLPRTAEFSFFSGELKRMRSKSNKNQLEESQARQDLEECVKRDRTHVACRFGLAELYSRSGDERAEGLLKEAKSMDPFSLYRPSEQLP
ncbi:hypothetical protein CH373_09970 [Leptospira perolatii]|uniref:O-antigen ligase-related domain-containing protein n=1 Tax=Leptospira perolatii TaxID=2023191 RepID=A0A2M9ZMI2_9LEPT|nr:O-antigen ligase family protein [Leptospira perolatii]PJZ70103.1 hypothetical protein CH360_07715 [Leptospira perolatii]PJZ73292.1 hypothetical protein CH373_09970 [Leptospira perolatii]